jgi:hypothetical protein
MFFGFKPSSLLGWGLFLYAVLETRINKRRFYRQDATHVPSAQGKRVRQVKHLSLLGKPRRREYRKILKADF